MARKTCWVLSQQFISSYLVTRLTILSKIDFIFSNSQVFFRFPSRQQDDIVSRQLMWLNCVFLCNRIAGALGWYFISFVWNSTVKVVDEPISDNMKKFIREFNLSTGLDIFYFYSSSLLFAPTFISIIFMLYVLLRSKISSTP